MTFASKIYRTQYNVSWSASASASAAEEVGGAYVPSVKCRASFSKWRLRLVNKVAGSNLLSNAGLGLLVPEGVPSGPGANASRAKASRLEAPTRRVPRAWIADRECREEWSVFITVVYLCIGHNSSLEVIRRALHNNCIARIVALR